MATSGMYSNELTFCAVPYIFNIELSYLVAPMNSMARARFTLDHFAEGLRNQDYFEYSLTDEDETVNNSTNNKLYLIKHHSSETI